MSKLVKEKTYKLTDFKSFFSAFFGFTTPEGFEAIRDENFDEVLKSSDISEEEKKELKTAYNNTDKAGKAFKKKFEVQTKNNKKTIQKTNRKLNSLNQQKEKTELSNKNQERERD